jgi:hypothetical protein
VLELASHLLEQELQELQQLGARQVVIEQELQQALVQQPVLELMRQELSHLALKY